MMEGIERSELFKMGNLLPSVQFWPFTLALCKALLHLATFTLIASRFQSGSNVLSDYSACIKIHITAIGSQICLFVELLEMERTSCFHVHVYMCVFLLPGLLFSLLSAVTCGFLYHWTVGECGWWPVAILSKP